MAKKLRVLIVEDAPADAELALRELRRAGIDCDAHRVETDADFRRALEEFGPDVILSDFSMPQFDGMRALAIARDVHPDIPFIFVSGTIGEDSAIEALSNGATDYVLKDKRLRLPSAVERAINQAQERVKRDNNERELKASSERLQDIVSSLRDVVWSVAVPSGELLYVSPSISTLYQKTAEQFYESRVLWGSLIHPEDRPRVATEWLKATQSGCYDCEHRIVLANGDIRWLHSRGQRADDTAVQSGCINGITQDITERWRQQQKIARLSRILIKVVRNVIAGKGRVSPCLVDLVVRGLENPNPSERLSHEKLSDRQLQILLLIGSGRSIKQIAGDLSISINTVNTYRARILKTMGMRTNAALIRYTIEHGLVE